MSLETTKSLSEKIHTPEYTIRKWTREKVLPAYRVGRKFFYDLDEVIKEIKKIKVY